jgi:hypothetical protein
MFDRPDRKLIIFAFMAIFVIYLSMDFMSQEHGVPRDRPKDSNAGAERGRSWIAPKHGDGSLECQTRNALQRERPSFTQVQGPRGEVKPLLPAFLYCNATPHEEYKVLVTKL